MKRFLGLTVIALAASFFSACSSGGGDDPGDPIVPPRGPFVSEWKTDNSGESGPNQISLPLVDTGVYNCVVDWGDDTTSEITSYDDSDKTHTYATAGTYTVTISGSIEGFSFDKQTTGPGGAYEGDSLKLLGISEWGIVKLGNAGGYFFRCANLQITATDTPDLSGTTNCTYMFAYCSSIETIPGLGGWDMGNVTDMSYMFCWASAFNGDVGPWDVSNVTTMRGMFNTASAFNQNLNSWDVSNVTEMRFLFGYAVHFNGRVDTWNVSNVTNMQGMFYYAQRFNGDLRSWNVSRVENMSNAFSDSGLSTENYSAFLSGISNRPSLQNNVTLGAGTIQYAATASAARSKLITDYGWTITDGGQQP